MKNVLIIEDEQNTALPVKEALELEGISADIAYDGATGVSMFKENRYDIVLLDLKMPKMNGEEVLKEVRKIDPYVDVIIYTNDNDFDDIKKLVNIGIDGYVNKGPTADLKKLVVTIKEKLDPLSNEDIDKLIKHTPPDIFEDQ